MRYGSNEDGKLLFFFNEPILLSAITAATKTRFAFPPIPRTAARDSNK